MRLRRLEMAVLALTLAFAFFMGGFFTGRSTGTVSIMAAQSEDGTISTQVSISQQTPVPQTPVQQTPAGQEETQHEQAPASAEADAQETPGGQAVQQEADAQETVQQVQGTGGAKGQRRQDKH